MLERVTRRTFLAGFSASFAIAAPPPVPSTQPRKAREIAPVGEFVRYLDPLTENPLVRLTSLASASRLPSPENAFVSARDRFLVFSSDRSGSFCPYFMDLRSGVIRQLTETKALDPLSLSLDQTERFLLFIDGGTLKQLHLSNHHVSTVAEDVGEYTGRATSELLVLRHGKLQRPAGDLLASDVAGPCLLSPDGGSCLLRRSSGAECEFLVVSTRSSSPAKRIAAGRVRSPFWSPDSQSILLLRDTDSNGVMISEIRRAAVDGTAEEGVSTAGQFASFAPNADATVFVTASRSKAQPTVELLLRTPKRELTLCEHHSAKPESVTPVFSPDSRRVYFQSDREGRQAIYSINVERLVEPTAFL